jgi:hypothetical protein
MEAHTSVRLDYSDEAFAERARRAITSGRTLIVVINGRAGELLASTMVNGAPSNPPSLGLHPLLQPLLGAWMLALGRGQSVSFESREETIVFCTSFPA